ncbi:hypothetical protein AAFF_G00110900 [Aldrovandia affinis]|uniref:Uncharacterized protein n=1 Tax=Aldrovandia affinis TaxID=143900 RepID=A0AAD7RTG9_9TELE|nr:hypothetical protein AAFF_G00110900 [Aldrovandia affinis]
MANPIPSPTPLFLRPSPSNCHHNKGFDSNIVPVGEELHSALLKGFSPSLSTGSFPLTLMRSPVTGWSWDTPYNCPSDWRRPAPLWEPLEGSQEAVRSDLGSGSDCKHSLVCRHGNQM